MVETCGQLRSSLLMFRPFRKHNRHVLTCNLMTFGDLIIGLPIGPILCVLERVHGNRLRVCYSYYSGVLQ